MQGDRMNKIYGLLLVAGGVLWLIVVNMEHRNPATISERNEHHEARNPSSKPQEAETPVQKEVEAKPTQKQAAPSDTKADGFLKARIAFAEFLNAAYQKQGRRLSVEANGPNKRTLELRSALLYEGSHTMEAALEVLEDADIYANVKHCGFTRVVFTGDRFSIEYSITDGVARRIR
jgi:hypothetical protein